MGYDQDIYDMVVSFEDLGESYEGEEFYTKARRALLEKGFSYGMEMHSEKSPRLRENLESEHEECTLSAWDSEDVETRIKFILEDGRKEKKGRKVEII